MAQFKRAYDLFIKHFKLCATEYMIYGEIAGETICGTIDALFWRDEEKREVIVVDWKSNSNLTFKKKIDVPGSPFHQNELTTVEKYYCQLHAYGYLLETFYDVKVVDYLIVHVKVDTYTIYSAPCRQECLCNVK